MAPLIDVNVLVAAHRADHPHHAPARAALDGPYAQGVALCAHTRNGFLRLVTLSNLFPEPTPLPIALAALEAWQSRPTSEVLLDTPTTWATFVDLCRRHHPTGNGMYDVHLAALAMATQRELVSFDAGFQRFVGLRWRRP